ncbi:MAG: toxic anion resistance protein [Synergistaceae bacterium]|jgi:uncharacterized protein YaaN involved in tellurite resistance|nr:toxic anion resistance protein [Synergistaceae bacterium]
MENGENNSGVVDLPQNNQADSLSIESLSPEEQARIREIAERIPLSNSNDILSYAADEARKIARNNDEILNAVRTKDLSEAGDALASLVSEIQNFDAARSGGEKKGLIASLFSGAGRGVKRTEGAADSIKHGIALTKKEIEALQNRYKTVLQNVDAVVDKLEEEQRNMLKNVVVMDRLYETNLEYFKSISAAIVAGRERLRIFEEREIESQKRKVAETNDQMEVQILNEKLDLANKFEKRLHDLTLSRTISIQSAPQIRMVQRGSEELVSQIQNSINTAIPVWKSQMVLALGLASNRTAAGIQKQVTDMTNDMLARNSETLKLGTLEIAAEGERGLVSLDTLKGTNENLIATINGVIEIQKKGRMERTSAQAELQKLEQDVKTVLLGGRVKK